MRVLILPFLWFIFLISCSQSQGPNTPSGNSPASGPKATLNLRAVNADLKLKNNVKMRDDNYNGSVTTNGLESLEFFFTSFALIQGGTPDQNGIIQGSSNTFMLWQQTAYPEPATPAAARASDNGYIDFENLASLSGFNPSVTLTLDNVGQYNYADATWAYYAKVKAVINIIGTGTNLYTQDPDYFAASGMGVLTNLTLTNSPETNALFNTRQNNSYFAFMKPFVITSNDILNNTNIYLNIVFNPDGYINGSLLGATLSDSITDISGASLTAPYFSAIPIITRQGENIVREVYEGTVNTNFASGWTANFEFRLDIYTIDADSNNIYAASLRDIVVNPSNSVDGQIILISASTNLNSTINFCIYDSSAYVSNFARLADTGNTVNALVKVEDQNTPNTLYFAPVLFTRIQ